MVTYVFLQDLDKRGGGACGASGTDMGIWCHVPGS